MKHATALTSAGVLDDDEFRRRLERGPFVFLPQMGPNAPRGVARLRQIATALREDRVVLQRGRREAEARDIPPSVLTSGQIAHNPDTCFLASTLATGQRLFVCVFVDDTLLLTAFPKTRGNPPGWWLALVYDAAYKTTDWDRAMTDRRDRPARRAEEVGRG